MVGLPGKPGNLGRPGETGLPGSQGSFGPKVSVMDRRLRKKKYDPVKVNSFKLDAVFFLCVSKIAHFFFAYLLCATCVHTEKCVKMKRSIHTLKAV